MKRKILCLLLICFSILSYSQEKPNISISADLGWNIGAYRETTFSGVTQKLFSPKVGLIFDIESQLFLHKITFNYDSCRPSSNQTETALVYKEFDPLTGESYYTGCYSFLSFHRINATYDCYYKMPVNSSKVEFELGGNFQANAYLQFENYPSITGILSIGPSAKCNFNFDDNNKVFLLLRSSVLGYGIRPPYAGCDALLMKYAEENFLKILTLGDFLSLHNYQTICMEVGYEHKITELVGFNTKIDCEYSRIAAPKEKPLYFVSSSLNTGIVFKF